MDVGIVVLTHGTLAEAFVETLFSIVGKKDKVVGIPVSTEFTFESLAAKIKDVVGRLNARYVLILTDILGGTPCRTSLMLCKELSNVGVVSGVNLCMLISAVNLRDTLDESFSFEEYINRIITESKKSIAYANEVLSKKIK